MRRCHRRLGEDADVPSVLAVLADAAITGRDVSALLAVLLEARRLWSFEQVARDGRERSAGPLRLFVHCPVSIVHCREGGRESSSSSSGGSRAAAMATRHEGGGGGERVSRQFSFRWRAPAHHTAARRLRVTTTWNAPSFKAGAVGERAAALLWSAQRATSNSGGRARCSGRYLNLNLYRRDFGGRFCGGEVVGGHVVGSGTPHSRLTIRLNDLKRPQLPPRLALVHDRLAEQAKVLAVVLARELLVLGVAWSGASVFSSLSSASSLLLPPPP